MATAVEEIRKETTEVTTEDTEKYARKYLRNYLRNYPERPPVRSLLRPIVVAPHYQVRGDKLRPDKPVRPRYLMGDTQGIYNHWLTLNLSVMGLWSDMALTMMKIGSRSSRPGWEENANRKWQKVAQVMSPIHRNMTEEETVDRLVDLFYL